MSRVLVPLANGFEVIEAINIIDVLRRAEIEVLIASLDKKGKNIGAICAAPLALHKAGVLKHNYTCYPSIEEQIGKDGFSDENMVVEDGNVMTSRGPATAICFALQIIKKLKGDEKYLSVKSSLLADFCE